MHSSARSRASECLDGTTRASAAKRSAAAMRTIPSSRSSRRSARGRTPRTRRARGRRSQSRGRSGSRRSRRLPAADESDLSCQHVATTSRRDGESKPRRDRACLSQRCEKRVPGRVFAPARRASSAARAPDHEIRAARGPRRRPGHLGCRLRRYVAQTPSAVSGLRRGAPDTRSSRGREGRRDRSRSASWMTWSRSSVRFTR